LKRNECKLVQKNSKLLLTILLRTNKKLKKQKSQETPFHSSSFENWLKKFWFVIVIQKNNLWNLKQIFYLNQLQRITIIGIWKSISQIHSFQSTNFKGEMNLGHQCTLKERRNFYKSYTIRRKIRAQESSYSFLSNIEENSMKPKPISLNKKETPKCPCCTCDYGWH
jgi:hypothetical protein